MKILVADDSKTNLAIISAALKRFGHEVMVANSGQKALEMFKADRPDLIILDVMMEGMDGFECAKRLRILCGDDWIPIIFLSASVDDESIAKGINSGGDDYLTKPFSEITLSAKIKAMQRIADMRKKLCDTTQKLYILSSTDTLTGVFNRSQFDKYSREKISEADRYQQKLALLFIDLDYFKVVNDTLGHHVGDLLLKEVVKRIKSCLRFSDFIARMGGDEFAVIFSNIENIESAGIAAKKIVNVLANPYHLGENEVLVSASIGIACYPEAGSTLEDLVERADIAMYHAKKLGRNNFQYFTDELTEKYKQQMNIRHELKSALEKRQFFIEYQPIYDIKTKTITGMEAMLRWKHPTMGLVAPNIFIPIAEETGLIVELGTWMLKTVCTQSAKWYEMGFSNIKVSINIALTQLIQKEFISNVQKILQETQVSLPMIEFELTETSMVHYPYLVQETLEKLHDLGINIAVAEFGMGSSSLMFIKRLPVSTIKIDEFFLHDLTTDSNNVIIIQSFIALGKNLGSNVIADGIETEQQLEFLIAQGCPEGQGVLLSPPVNVDQITNFLNKQKAKELNIM